MIKKRKARGLAVLGLIGLMVLGGAAAVSAASHSGRRCTPTASGAGSLP